MRQWTTIFRLLAFLAVLGLGLSGGVYSHAYEIGHAHSHNSDHGTDHSHGKNDCCETETNQMIHCGANLLALDENYSLISPRLVRLRQLPANLTGNGTYKSLEPPPPRSILV